LPVKSSPESVWAACTVDWPVHLLELSVEVVEPRKLTALEWVLLRVVDEFSTAPPPLAEVADELGLDRPEFLRDTLKELLRLRAVAPRDPAVRVVDLDTVAFTDTGVALYRRGKIEGEPATRGITVLIDALTDEDLPPPTSQKKQAAGSNTKGTRQTFGLDRTRDVMHRFHADILRGDAEVRAVTVRSSIDSERAVDLHFSFTSDGALSVDSGELSTAALAQLRERDLIAEDLIPRSAASEAWTEPLTPRDSASSNFAGWRMRTTRTLPSSMIAAEAIAQIHQARRELVLHALWLAAPGVRAAVDAARAHGVHVLVASAGVTRLDLKPHGARLSCEVQATSAILLPGALIIDGFAGLLLADIELGWQGQPVICELGGSLNEATARAVRDALVEASLAAIDHDVVLPLDPATSARVRSPVLDLLAPLPGFPAHVAGLLFRGALTHVEALQQRVATHHRGLQRLAAQRALHGLGSALALEFPAVVWEAPWNASWQQCFAELRDVHPLPLEQVRALLALAPPDMRAAAFIGPAVATWVPATSAIADRGALVALRQIAESSAQRWGAGIAHSDPAWTAARNHWLTPDKPTADSVVTLAGEAPSLLGLDEVRVWASRILAALPRPPSFAASEPWLRGALALRPIIGAPWDAHVLEVWRALLAADPDNQETAIARGLALLRVEELAPIFLAQATDAGQVLALRHRFQKARADTLRAPLWAAALRARLPKLASTFRAREHGPLVRSLAVGVTEWPEGKTIVSTWAQTIADNLRQAADLHALVFWLDELGALGPALAAELLPLALAALQPHLRALRDARARELPIWPILQGAWRKLGLPVERLERQASPPTSTTGTPPKKGPRR
jgi:hypothetical protein